MEMQNSCRELMREWVGRKAAPAALAWLDQSIAKAAAGATDRDVYLAVSLATRKLGKSDLQLTTSDIAQAGHVRTGWMPQNWTVAQAGRLLLVLTIDDPGRLASLIDQLCTTADVGELVTFYSGLPLYPGPERYLVRALEAGRSNMKAVFNALAHHNPYPAENFDQNAWNQMVLKAVFIGSPLWPIQRLDERANPALARMLCDYAHERWAANRTVSPELWRCVGRHSDVQAVQDLARVLKQGSALEQRAALLALSESPSHAAKDILAARSGSTNAIAAAETGWDDIGRDMQI